MDVTGEKLAADRLSLKELREMGRDQIAELVAAGLLPADLAAEIQSEYIQQKEDQQQSDTRQHLQARVQQDEEKKDEDWLGKMSQSYQESYHALMDTYDDAESKYGTIEARAEKLQDSLRQKMETARQYGISLPDGEQAFLDTKHNAFVDGSLQPLNEADAKEAAAEFKLLTPQQQKANACYVSACDAFSDAADISRVANAGRENVETAKEDLENSQGTISETKLKEMGATVRAQTAGLTDRLNKAESADTSLDEVLSADAETSVTPAKSSPANAISFASMVAPTGNVLTDGNGKTATAFNTAANSVQQADVPKPDRRMAPVAPVPVAPAM